MPGPPREVVKVEEALQVPASITAMPEEPEVSRPVPPYWAPIAEPFHVPCATVPSRELVAKRFPIVDEAIFKTVADEEAEFKIMAPVTPRLVVVALVARRFEMVDEAILKTVAEDEAVFAMNWFDT